MRAFFRIALSIGLAATLTTSATLAEPAQTNDISQPSMVSMDGPDRQPRAQEPAPQRETVRTPQTERSTPPPAPAPAPAPQSRGMKLDMNKYKTLTDTPHDINGARVHVDVPVEWAMNNWVQADVPNDTYVPNHHEAMGADLELFSHVRLARIGIWAGKAIQDKSPKSIVNSMSERMQELTGGNWTPARAVNVAGIPAERITGVDVFGNYHYEIYSWERFGQHYAIALRTPYENRWDTDLNTDIAYIVTHMHPTYQWVQAEMGHK